MSKDIKHIIAAVVDEVSTSPDFGSSIETPGIIANVISSLLLFSLFSCLDFKTAS